MTSQQDARDALKRIARDEQTEREQDARVVASDGSRFATVRTDGGTLLDVHRGSYQPVLGAYVKIYLPPNGGSRWKIVGAADKTIATRDSNRYDIERQGDPLYYPVALEAINNTSYNLGTTLNITIYNIHFVASDGALHRVNTVLLDLATNVPASDSAWRIIYVDERDDSIGVYDAASTAAPGIGDAFTAANDAMTADSHRVPLLAVLLDSGMTEWGSAWRVMGRGYDIADKKIVRLPYYGKPATSGELSASTIGELSDVDDDTTSPADGQALLWDAAASLYLPGDVGSALVIEEEDGTPTGTPASLRLTSGKVTDNSDGSFSIDLSGNVAAAGDLSDVDTTGVAEGDLLQYNASASEFQPVAIRTIRPLDISIAGGRLTLATGDPENTNTTGASTLRFTPYKGNRIALYDGSDWALYTFSEMSESLSGLSASTVYDVFAYANNGAVALEFVAWTNDTTRATGLAWQDGIRIKSGDATRRYIGSIRPDSNKQLTVASTTCLISNYYNRVPIRLYIYLNDQHTYSGSYRIWTGGTSGNTVNVDMLLLDDEMYTAGIFGTFSSTSGDSIRMGFAIDGTFARTVSLTQSTAAVPAHPGDTITGVNGYRNLRVLEQGGGVGGTFFEAGIILAGKF